MNDRELYQQVILEHNRSPKNFGELIDCTHRMEGNNPLCGDRLTITCVVDNDRVKEIRFQGDGCAISKASASMMTQAVKGETESEVKEKFDLFRELIMGKSLGVEKSEKLGKLRIFSGISQYPARVKCAILAWHTLIAALEGKTNEVSTENENQ